MPDRRAPIPAANRAGMLCADPRFAEFIAAQHGHFGNPADFLRDFCSIESRRDLNTDPAARDRFDRLLTAFDAFTGKIPPQR